MRLLITRLVLVLALFAGAAMCWVEARAIRERADVHERLATLHYDRAAGADIATPLVSSLLRDAGRDVALMKARGDYWMGGFDRLISASNATGTDPDPEVLLLAANAAFREAQRATEPKPAQMQRLDSVLQGYASALKSGRFLPDAAYNYEFVARVKDTLGRPNRAAELSARALEARAGSDPRSSDLPTGSTIHGRPGGPPPGTKGEEFEIITPMEFGDRESQPEPNAGGKPLRKG